MTCIKSKISKLNVLLREKKRINPFKFYIFITVLIHLFNHSLFCELIFLINFIGKITVAAILLSLSEALAASEVDHLICKSLCSLEITEIMAGSYKNTDKVIFFQLIFSILN